MLLATQQGRHALQGLAYNSQLRMGLAGSAENQALQQALVGLATATNRPQINPGKVDGVINTQTVMAVIAATDLLSESLPSWAFLSLKAATASAAASKTATTQAVKGIEALAGPLTIAVQTAAVKFKQNPALIPVAPVEPWYKTPIGMIAIGVGLLVGYKVLLAPPAK